MPRLVVKLLLLDQTDRLLLIHARDPRNGTCCWYPVGGGVEQGESIQDAAAREAHEETGLRRLPLGQHIWRRDHIYRFNGRIIPVHEEWLLHRIEHFQPAPSQLTDDESETIVGFDWWNSRPRNDHRDRLSATARQADQHPSWSRTPQGSDRHQRTRSRDLINPRLKRILDRASRHWAADADRYCNNPAQSTQLSCSGSRSIIE